LRRLFVSGRLDFAMKVPAYGPADARSVNISVPTYDPPLCSPKTRAPLIINGGKKGIEPYPSLKQSQCSDLAPDRERQVVQNLQRMIAAE